MKRITKILYSLSVSLFLSFSGLLAGTVHAAGSATMYLSPASGSVNLGDTLTLEIHVNTSDPAYLARAAITYPAASLTFVNFTPSPAFPITAASKGGGGTAEYDGATASPVTGDQILATVTFIAAQGYGTATVDLNGPDQSNPNDYSASSVQGYNGGVVELLSSTSGGTYTLTGGTPPPSGGSGSGSSSSSSSGSSSSTSSSTPKSSSSSSSSTGTSSKTAAPAAQNVSSVTISKISVSNLSDNTATISWQTSAATTSEVDYGTSTNNYKFSSTSATMATSHKQVIDPLTLIPGTLYHFVVKGTDGSGKVVASQDQTFRTSGTVLVVTVLDQHNKAVKGADVTIAEVTATTNSSGKATLKDLPTGPQKASVFLDGVTTNTTVQVTAGSGQAGTATIRINVPSSRLALILPIVGIAAIVIVLSLVRMFYLKHHESSKELSSHFPKLPTKAAGSDPTNNLPGIIMPGPTSTPKTPSTSVRPGDTIDPNDTQKK